MYQVSFIEGLFYCKNSGDYWNTSQRPPPQGGGSLKERGYRGGRGSDREGQKETVAFPSGGGGDASERASVRACAPLSSVPRGSRCCSAGIRSWTWRAAPCCARPRRAHAPRKRTRPDHDRLDRPCIGSAQKTTISGDYERARPTPATRAPGAQRRGERFSPAPP